MTIAMGFDNETTDLIRSRSRPLKAQPFITEFFGLTLQGVPVQAIGEALPTTKWTEVKATHSLFYPGFPLSEEVKKITHMDDDLLKDAPRFAEKAGEIKKCIEEADLVFAHNLGFDKMMIDFEMERCGLKVKWPRQVCTVEATEHLLGRRLKLIELYQHLFGEEFEGAHRAENDVRPMVRIFIELSNRGVI